MSKILVTGAGGFIGSHLVERLVGSGHKVTALCRYTSTSSVGLLKETEVLDDIEIKYGDVRSRDDVMNAVEGNDIIMHLAAQIAIPWSYLSPAEFVQTNTIGTMNVLMAGRKWNVDRIVHMSTSEVYGTATTIPMNEFHPQVAQSPYSASKIAADKLCQSFNRSYGTPVVIARPFNTYGPRQSNRAIIPSVILQILGNKKTIQLGSMTASRDFNFVNDTVNNLICMALSKEGAGDEFNLASGKSYKLVEIVGKISYLLGCETECVLDPKRVRPINSEVERLIGDSRKANKLFELPDRTDIMTGLAKTIEYFKSHYREERFTL